MMRWENKADGDGEEIMTMMMQRLGKKNETFFPVLVVHSMHAGHLVSAGRAVHPLSSPALLSSLSSQMTECEYACIHVIMCWQNTALHLQLLLSSFSYDFLASCLVSGTTAAASTGGS
jgi:hypothetical protein